MKKIAWLTILMFVFSPVIVQAFDPLESQQWYLENLNVKAAWSLTTGSRDVIVAVIDTGVDLDHPDLRDNIWVNQFEAIDGIDNDKNGYIDDIYGWNFLDNNNNPQPDIESDYKYEAVSHGTFVAGVIAGVHDNNRDIKGITSNVKIMSLVALDSNGYGDEEAVIKALDYAIENGAQVINLSFVSYDYLPSLKKRIIQAEQRGIIIVSAVGNNSLGGDNLEKKKVYPVCYDLEFGRDIIVGVGSTDRLNELSYFSNYGASCLDILAPGEDLVGLVYQTDLNPDFKPFNATDFKGTSFATPMVSGTVALMKSINKNLTVAAVNRILKATATNIDAQNPKYIGALGAGLLNTEAAVKKTYEDYAAGKNVRIFVSPDRDKPAAVKVYNKNLVFEKEISIFNDDTKGLNISTADIDFDGWQDFVVGTASGYAPYVRAVSLDGRLISSFFAYEEKFLGGVKVAAADLNNDSTVEFVTTPFSQKSSKVRIFSSTGKLYKEFLAFDEKYQTAVSLALANVTGDAKKEIIVGAPAGSLPEVRVFDLDGKLIKTLKVFNDSFTGGVNVTAANLDNKGYFEIVVSAVSGQPQVKIIDYNGQVKSSFLAYDQNFSGGVRVFCGEINNDGQPEIITAPGPGGYSQVRVFSPYGALYNENYVYEHTYLGGVQAAVID